MFDPYVLIIAFSLIIGLSYIYNILSQKLKVPSVLFLIFTGIVINYTGKYFNIDFFGTHLFDLLQLLGIIGLIMIVLEAAVDLKLSKDKAPVIGKSFLLALIILVITSLGIAIVIQITLAEPLMNSLAYAIPLSVVSSAVLIPSVHSLTKSKKEFMIYESTFSDIIGIMVFNFIVMQPAGKIFSSSGIISIVITVVISFILSYILVYFFCRIKTEIKLFLMISILALLYAVGKQFHLSSLLIILVFGLVMNNTRIFFSGGLSRFMDFDAAGRVCKDFRTITSETAFLVRTFFFVVFGMSINLAVFADFTVIAIGSIIVIILFIVRFLNFKIFLRTNAFPEIFLAPRGLITILLFYSIPLHYQIRNFSIGILFFVILTTSIIMMFALIKTPMDKHDEIKILDVGTYHPNDLINSEPAGPYCEIENKD